MISSMALAMAICGDGPFASRQNVNAQPAALVPATPVFATTDQPVNRQMFFSTNVMQSYNAPQTFGVIQWRVPQFKCNLGWIRFNRVQDTQPVTQQIGWQAIQNQPTVASPAAIPQVPEKQTPQAAALPQLPPTKASTQGGGDSLDSEAVRILSEGQKEQSIALRELLKQNQEILLELRKSKEGEAKNEKPQNDRSDPTKPPVID